MIPFDFLAGLSTGNTGPLIVLSLLVVLGYAYLFFWRTETKTKEGVLEKELDVLILSLLFSSIFVISTIGWLTSYGLFFQKPSSIISFDFVLYSYMTLIFFIVFFNKFKGLAIKIPEYFEKNIYKLTFIALIPIIIGYILIETAIFPDYLELISRICLAPVFIFFFTLIPLVFVIILTKRAFVIKS
ncbi:MAG: hypothetical protein JW716_02600 [Candidatus Aenigmarchaeota archaeon]|nr:hypothetical protein [Candidatus Aenigmarchaeota archaeon]